MTTLGQFLSNATFPSQFKWGTATLAAGTATVVDADAHTTSIILLTAQTAGGVTAAIRVNNKAEGSFDIVSSSGLDASEVAYLIVNP